MAAMRIVPSSMNLKTAIQLGLGLEAGAVEQLAFKHGGKGFI